MDTLSEVLECVRSEGARFIDVELRAPWSMRSDFGQRGLLERVPSASHVVGFWFISEGRCKVQRDGSSVVDEAVAGDALLFLGRDRHRIGSHLYVAPLEEAGAAIDTASASVASTRVLAGAGGELARIVIGSVACAPAMVHALLETLPSFVHVRSGDPRDGSGIRELLRIGVRESSAVRPGVDSALARLSEWVLVDALRRHAEQVPSEHRGWVAAARDERIGRALALMHAEPGRAWTLDELARSVALSRSALADRFARLVGQPPMRYLTRWRLALAAQTLRSGAEAIVRIAERAGYDSDAAFSRAFQREFAMPPARWRRRAPA